MVFMKIANFVPINLQTWLPQAILISDWLISKKSSPLKPHGQMNRNLIGNILGRSILIHLAKGLQRRRFLEINQSETRIVCGGHVCSPNGTKWRNFIENLT
jgi:hypothetical protein